MIRDVPADVHEALVRRAAAEGRSLQQYTLRMISEAARGRTPGEVLDQIRRRASAFPPITNDQIVADLRSDREGDRGVFD